MFLSCIGDPDAVGDGCISWLRHPKHNKVNKHSNDKGRRKSHHVKGEDRARRTSRAYPSGKADDDHDGKGRRMSKYTCSETPKLKDLTKNMQGMGKVVGSFTGPTSPTEEPEVITEGDLVLPNEDQNKGHRNGNDIDKAPDKAHDKGHRRSHDKSHDKGHDKTKSPPNSIGKRSKSAVSMPHKSPPNSIGKRSKSAVSISHDKGHEKGRDKRSHSSAKIQSEVSGSRSSLVSNQHDPHTRRRSKV